MGLGFTNVNLRVLERLIPVVENAHSTTTYTVDPKYLSRVVKGDLTPEEKQIAKVAFIYAIPEAFESDIDMFVSELETVLSQPNVTIDDVVRVHGISKARFAYYFLKMLMTKLYGKQFGAETYEAERYRNYRSIMKGFEDE